MIPREKSVGSRISESNPNIFQPQQKYLDGQLGLLGSMVKINGLFHLLANGVYWGYNPLILTFDPNFLGHPSKGDQ